VKEYTVIVKLGEEAIHLEASNEDDAIDKAREIIAEQYSWDLSRSNTVSYEIEGEGECDKCEDAYELSDKTNRCGDCGNCNNCCTHEGEGK